MGRLFRTPWGHRHTASANVPAAHTLLHVSQLRRIVRCVRLTAVLLPSHRNRPIPRHNPSTAHEPPCTPSRPYWAGSVHAWPHPATVGGIALKTSVQPAVQQLRRHGTDRPAIAARWWKHARATSAYTACANESAGATVVRIVRNRHAAAHSRAAHLAGAAHTRIARPARAPTVHTHLSRRAAHKARPAVRRIARGVHARPGAIGLCSRANHCRARAIRRKAASPHHADFAALTRHAARAAVVRVVRADARPAAAEQPGRTRRSRTRSPANTRARYAALTGRTLQPTTRRSCSDRSSDRSIPWDNTAATSLGNETGTSRGRTSP